MVDLAGAGRTVLLSSHQIGEVERVASHVALLHQGRLILAEALDELKAHTFVVSVLFAGRDHPEAPPEGRGLELIDASDAPRQARWLVRAPDRSACESVRAMPGVEAVEVETPGLEEIYLGYMRSCPSSVVRGPWSADADVRAGRSA
jgi:ABC-2 type transport system ATP-binding protein